MTSTKQLLFFHIPGPIKDQHWQGFKPNTPTNFSHNGTDYHFCYSELIGKQITLSSRF